LPRCHSARTALATTAAFLALAPSTAGAAIAFGDRPLRQGMRGHDVRVLQNYLTRAGVRTTVDGQYGPQTAQRVRTWERRSHRHEDGRVSRRDARALRREVTQTGGANAPSPGPPSTTQTPIPNPSGRAILNDDGTATAPDSAPEPVKQVIAAANEIVGKPYRRGGGHRRWAINDSAVDCSGAVSWALHGGGLLDAPVPSGALMKWGKRRKGRWITVYANAGHVYMIVAKQRFDTGWHDGDGPRWTNVKRPSAGFKRRHQPGL
jgi:peptidoglycan hydrolase-like protein with peptidoglycan-binding domain